MASEEYFHRGELRAQDTWGTRKTWDAGRRQQLLWDRIPEPFLQRFESAPYFFLATSDDQGRCDCSFKGGGNGLIRLLDPRSFAFPDFDGNGAFMSIGNILVNPHVGCLFLDFQDGARLRVNGRAEVLHGRDQNLFERADRVILVQIDQVIPNCAQHIPLMRPAVDGAGR
ncbi:MAG: pyridoxamine 5'-phosphate oxidase family protein [Pseudomonadales bacterium]|nr:pyridoxamine 5'-phosphate oxidase family protein [Pseudomonadales bacterium]